MKNLPNNRQPHPHFDEPILPPTKISRIEAEFEKSLEQFDQAKKSKLTRVWRDCLRIHDENELLRTQFREHFLIVQDLYQTYSSERERLARLIKTVEEKFATDQKAEDVTENMDQYLDQLKTVHSMQEKIVKQLNDTAKLSVTMKKELRTTEFQSRFFFHANIIQQWMVGLTGILFKHLQATDKMDAILVDIKRYMNMTDMKTIELGEDAPETKEGEEDDGTTTVRNE